MGDSAFIEGNAVVKLFWLFSTLTSVPKSIIKNRERVKSGKTLRRTSLAIGEVLAMWLGNVLRGVRHWVRLWFRRRARLHWYRCAWFHRAYHSLKHAIGARAANVCQGQGCQVVPKASGTHEQLHQNGPGQVERIANWKADGSTALWLFCQN